MCLRKDAISARAAAGANAIKSEDEMKVIAQCTRCAIQTVDKVPGLPRGFSIAVINISMILPVFIKKNSLLINSKVKWYVPCTWYNYPIRRFRL